MAEPALAPTSRRRRTPRQERLHRQQRLAATLRIFAELGYDEGAGGHATARDPVFPDRFWVNAFGQPFDQVRVSDLLLVDHAGRVLSGAGRVNPAGYVIHSHIHAAHPEVVSAVHTHSVYGRAWSTLGRLLDPITQDACAFYEAHAVYENYTGVVLDHAEAEAIAERRGEHKALILANHGLLTVGGSVEEAAWWFVAMERSCQVQLLAEAAGRPRVIAHEAAVRTREQIGSPGLGRLNFRPMFESVLRRQPELVD